VKKGLAFAKEKLQIRKSQLVFALIFFLLLRLTVWAIISSGLKAETFHPYNVTGCLDQTIDV
jgi:hypothetical protein